MLRQYMNIQYEVNKYNSQYRLQFRYNFLSIYKNAVVQMIPRFLFFNQKQNK